MKMVVCQYVTCIQERDKIIRFTGGFHTPFLTDELKIQDIAYCVIAPRITQPADDAQYVRILKEKAGIK